MNEKLLRGSAIFELILFVPLLMLIITFAFIAFISLSSKNIALSDAFDINRVAFKEKQVITQAFSKKIYIFNNPVSLKNDHGNVSTTSIFSSLPLSGSCSTSIDFKPKTMYMLGTSETIKYPFKEKSLLIQDTWDENSKKGKGLKNMINTILYSKFLKLLKG